jgi:hypothetical protein
MNGENTSHGDSLFNDGVGYVQRLDYILARLMKAREEKNAERWLDFLRSLYLEAEAGMSIEERDAAKKGFDEIIRAKNSWKLLPTTKRPLITDGLMVSLMDQELLLRRTRLVKQINIPERIKESDDDNDFA